jgi:hypothetical protein
VKKRDRTLRSAWAAGIVGVFVLFLTMSAPHRVHHLLEDLSAPKTEGGEDHNPSRSPAPNHQHEISQSLDLKAPNDSHGHFSHAPDHDKKSKHDHHHHSHSHKHFHQTHGHKADLAPAESGAGSERAEVLPFHANTPKNDAHHDDSAKTVCIVQAAAQHAHLAPAECGAVLFLVRESASRQSRADLNQALFNPSPFSQRAPPKA